MLCQPTLRFLLHEVTFYAQVGNGEWKSIGTDDTRPYGCTTTSAQSQTASR